MHIKSISVFITAALCLYASVFTVFAADTPKTTGSKALTFAFLVVLFIAALVSSTVLSYKWRTKKMAQQTKNAEETTNPSSDNKEN